MIKSVLKSEVGSKTKANSNTNKTDFDIAIIGAGPAGMSAACLADAAGASVVMLDDQGAAGGQIYRGISNRERWPAEILGKEYIQGRAIYERLQSSNVKRLSNAVVWHIDEPGLITYSRAGVASRLTARHVILATGAIERSVPIPGWTLPGVMSVGAAQILLKQHGLLAPGAILYGNGPLLYQMAVQMIRAGCKPMAIVETAGNYRAALTKLPRSLKAYQLLIKGLGMLLTIRRHGVPVYAHASRASVVQTTSDSTALALKFSSKGREFSLDSTSVFLHQGVVPNVQLMRALELDHVWNPAQHCFNPVLDDQLVSSRFSWLSVAGDAQSVNGAKAAALSGELAALYALKLIEHEKVDKQGAQHELGETNSYKSKVARLQIEYSKHTSVRAFLDALYPPSAECLEPADQSIVCRCEQVKASDIRRYVELGCLGPNQTKAFGRCGMGPCQGRYCGLTVTEIIARSSGLSHDEVGYYRIRMPIKPVTLGELASIEQQKG